MASVFRVHSPSFQSIVIATAGQVLARPVREPTGLTTDTRDDLGGACFVALTGDRFDGHAFVSDAARAGAALAIVERTPDLASLPEGFGVLQVASTRRALGAIAHAWRRSLRRLRVVAVTGSAGKTTTRRLLEGILAETGPTQASPKSFNNDIGVPLTLLSTPDSARFLVAEIGMNHPGEILPLAEMVEPEGRSSRSRGGRTSRGSAPSRPWRPKRRRSSRAFRSMALGWSTGTILRSSGRWRSWSRRGERRRGSSGLAWSLAATTGSSGARRTRTAIGSRWLRRAA